jgi:hypothetical protein
MSERRILAEVPGCRIWSDGTIETVPMKKMTETCRIMPADFAHGYEGFGGRAPPKHIVGKQNISELERLAAKSSPTKRPMDSKESEPIVSSNIGIGTAGYFDEKGRFWVPKE